MTLLWDREDGFGLALEIGLRNFGFQVRRVATPTEATAVEGDVVLAKARLLGAGEPPGDAIVVSGEKPDCEAVCREVLRLAAERRRDGNHRPA